MKGSEKFALGVDAKRRLIQDLNVLHRPKQTRRNVLIGALLLSLFCTLLLAKLSAVQAYCLSISFLSLAAYAIVLRLRE